MCATSSYRVTTVTRSPLASTYETGQVSRSSWRSGHGSRWTSGSNGWKPFGQGGTSIRDLGRGWADVDGEVRTTRRRVDHRLLVDDAEPVSPYDSPVVGAKLEDRR